MNGYVENPSNEIPTDLKRNVRLEFMPLIDPMTWIKTTAREIFENIIIYVKLLNVHDNINTRWETNCTAVSSAHALKLSNVNTLCNRELISFSTELYNNIINIILVYNYTVQSSWYKYAFRCHIISKNLLRIKRTQ